MTRPPTHPRARARALRPGVEYEFETLLIPPDFSRSLVTRMLVDRAEHGGWELARVRISADGVRRIVLRRRIMRVSPAWLAS